MGFSCDWLKVIKEATFPYSGILGQRQDWVRDCIVLMGRSLLPNPLRPFQIYCAPPNLGITRTRICRLNFAQRPIFLGLRFLNEPEISDSDPQLKVPPGGLVLRIYTSWKILSWIWSREPWISRRAHYSETTEADNTI